MNAELLILGQRHFADDEHRLAVLSAQGHVVHAEVYVAWMPNGNVLRGCGRIEQMGKFGSAPRTSRSQKPSLEKATTNLGPTNESSKSAMHWLRFSLLFDLLYVCSDKVAVSAHPRNTCLRCEEIGSTLATRRCSSTTSCCLSASSRRNFTKSTICLCSDLKVLAS